MEKFRLDQKYADTPLWDLSDSNSMQQIEAVQNRGIIIIELIKKTFKNKGRLLDWNNSKIGANCIVSHC